MFANDYLGIEIELFARGKRDDWKMWRKPSNRRLCTGLGYICQSFIDEIIIYEKG